MQIPLYNCMLRPWRQGDQAALVAYANNIKLWNNMRDTFPHPYTWEDADYWIAHSEQLAIHNPHFVQHFAIEVGGEAIGGIGVIPMTDVYRLQAEIGYWIGEPFWGRGLMTEVVPAAAHYFFTQGGFLRLHANVYEHNIASRRVLEKSGFTLRYIISKASIKNGILIDNYQYDLYKPMY